MSFKSTSFKVDLALSMPLRTHNILAISLVLLAGALSGCASINQTLSATLADKVPRWAGGLPPDAPPRPGTAQYDEFMRERERLRRMPAAEREREQQEKSEQSAPDPVH